jgi:type VI secretion system secreted protein Hcp
MAYQFHVTVTGSKQGVFKGDSAKDKDKNKIIGLGFRYGASINVAAATGAATGKRQYSPITFTKQWGAASPQFIQALATNENLTVVLFEFTKITPSGEEKVYYTIKLIDARVSSLEQFSGNLSAIASSTAELDEISLVFHKIEIHSVDGNTQVADDWSTSL